MANTLVVWTSPLIMISGAASLILGIINITLGQIVGLIPSVLITYIPYIVEDLAKLPFAQIKLDQTNFITWLGYYIFLFGILLMLKRKRVEKHEDML